MCRCHDRGDPSVLPVGSEDSRRAKSRGSDVSARGVRYISRLEQKDSEERIE